MLSVHSGILTSCCPAVITDRRKNSGWRHFVFPCILPVLFHCPFVNSDVQSLSARRANQHLVTFKMTIWVSVKSATSLCLPATHYLQTRTKNKAGQCESAGSHAIRRTDHIRAWRWLWDWGHFFSFIRSGNADLNRKTSVGTYLTAWWCQFRIAAKQSKPGGSVTVHQPCNISNLRWM